MWQWKLQHKDAHTVWYLMHLTNLNAKDATRPFSQKMLISKQCSVYTVSCVGGKKEEEEDSKVYGHGAYCYDC